MTPWSLAPWQRRALRALLAAGVMLAVWLTLRHIDWEAFKKALVAADVSWLLLAMACNFALLAAKSWSWHILLWPRFDVPTSRILRYSIAAFGVSSITPVRAGEALRVWLLKDRDGVPMKVAVGVAAVEKICDTVALLFIIAPLPWFLPNLPTAVARTIGSAWLVFLGIVAAAWGLRHVLLRQPRLARLFAALHGLFDIPRAQLIRAFALLFCGWGIDLGMLLAVGIAVHVPLPWSEGLLILLFLNLAIAIPSTPAQVGAMEMGIIAGLTLLGIQGERAIAFALLYHGIQILPLMLAMLLDLRFILAARRGVVA
jgi:uncharacterized membrane protein YbhN (UPF0104 family)